MHFTSAMDEFVEVYMLKIILLDYQINYVGRSHITQAMLTTIFLHFSNRFERPP